VELDLVAAAALSVVRLQLGRIAVRGIGEGERLAPAQFLAKRCEPVARARESRARQVERQRVRERGVRRHQVVVLERRALVEDLVRRGHARPV